MKRASILFAGALATVLLGGPAVAAGPSDTSTHGTTVQASNTSRVAASESTTAPAEKPGKLAIPHHVKGDVVSVDASAKTIAVRDAKGKEFNLVADQDTAAELGRLKTGDQVKVTYKKSHGQMVMTKITMATTGRTTTR